MSQKRIACFAVSDANHFIGVLAVASELRKTGARVRIWTDKRFRGQITAAGIEFGDLFEGGTIDDADPLSIPRAARIVTFSVRHCEALTRTVSDWRPDLICVEGFALIGQLIAQRLLRPWFLINSGHLLNGLALRKLARAEFPKRISEECLRAVERLRTEFGHEDASPYSYISKPSPWTNIHLEPPQWLPADTEDPPRQMECFGSHLSVPEKPTRTTPLNGSTFRIYAAFGTIVWRYWTEDALKLLESLADAVERLPSHSLTIGLGGAAISDRDMKRISRECVTILPYADQINQLRSHDLFVTHNGMNSTHEAVMLQIPMMSCPFFLDQPDLARLCLEYGISRRLSDNAISGNAPPVTAECFVEEILMAIADRDAMSEDLSRVQKWEVETISRRKPMLESILHRF